MVKPEDILVEVHLEVLLSHAMMVPSAPPSRLLPARCVLPHVRLVDLDGAFTADHVAVGGAPRGTGKSGTPSSESRSRRWT